MFVLTLILIPNLLVLSQGNLQTSIGENNNNELDAFQIPKESTVYYADTSGTANGVFVTGGLAYVADGYSGLAIILILNSTNPGTPVYEDTSGNAHDVYVSEDYAYVADGNRLAIINISDPTNPRVPIYQNTNGSAYGIYVDGDFAYVASYRSGLTIINITDPTNPEFLAYKDTSGDAWNVYVDGDFAYVADGPSGLAIINISDPTNPGVPVYEDTSGLAWDVYVSGEFAYVADGPSGLAIINISDPTNSGAPVYEDTSGSAHDVYVDGDLAYVADTYDLAIIYISDPTNPEVLVYEDTSGLAYGVYVVGEYAYVADYSSGLGIIHIREILGPVITNTPSDFTVDFGYTGVDISWTATSQDPKNYTIQHQGAEIVSPSAWLNGTIVTYNVPNGLAVGNHIYTVNFTDDYDNFLTDSVTMTVRDTANPVITNPPSDFSVNLGYTGVTISWRVTETYPSTYTIELEGSGIVAGPRAYISLITYDIPDGLALGEYNYTVTFTDDYDNFVTDTVIMTVKKKSEAIPYGNYYLIFLIIGIISLATIQKRRKKLSYE